MHRSPLPGCIHAKPPDLGGPGQLHAEAQGNKIPSPAILQHMSEEFHRRLNTYAKGHQISFVHFELNERMDDVAKHSLADCPNRKCVMFIGVAQEKAWWSCCLDRHHNDLWRDGGAYVPCSDYGYRQLLFRARRKQVSRFQ